MNLPTRLAAALLGLLCGIAAADAQVVDFPDPTAESPQIQSQLDSVRGVAELSELRRHVEELAADNAKLQSQVNAMSLASQKLNEDLESLRANRDADERRRRAIPELRLVAQLRTETISRAEIIAGDVTYRINSETEFLLQLLNGQSVTAKPKFLPTGEVEVDMPELDTSRRLTFRATPPS